MCHIKFKVNMLEHHSLKSPKINSAHTGLMCRRCLYVTGWCQHVRIHKRGFHVMTAWSNSVAAMSHWIFRIYVFHMLEVLILHRWLWSRKGLWDLFKLRATVSQKTVERFGWGFILKRGTENKFVFEFNKLNYNCNFVLISENKERIPCWQCWDISSKTVWECGCDILRLRLTPAAGSPKVIFPKMLENSLFSRSSVLILWSFSVEAPMWISSLILS